MVTSVSPQAGDDGHDVGLLQRYRVPVSLFLAFFALYGLTAARGAVSIDAHATAVEAWHIGSTGSPWLEGDMAGLSKDPWLVEAPNGHVVAHRMAGPILAGIPFYWMHDLATGQSGFDPVPGAIAAATLTASTCLLMFQALRSRLSMETAVAATVAFGLATPTWSVSANALWTHTVTQFGIAGACYGVSRSRWLLAGAFLAAGMTGRPHLALIAAVLGMGLAWSSRSWRPALGIAVPTAAALPALMLWNRGMFGTSSLGGGGYGGKAEAAVAGFHGPDGQASQLVNFLGFFVAPDRGFLLWSPLIVVLIPVVVARWNSLPEWSRWLVPSGALYTFAQLRINDFSGGDAFYGYRIGLELLTCIAPACAFAIIGSGPATRALTISGLGLQTAAIAWGAITEGFFVPMKDVWVDNSLWLALRHYPLLVSLWLSAGLLLAWLTARWIASRDDEESTSESLAASSTAAP